jgi:radical SAM superfamily enzyme YgiQ (UPF0313 family)
MYLAQGLRHKNSEFEVQILDAVAEKLDYRQIIDRVKEYGPQIVGLTAFTFTFYDVWYTAMELKKECPGTPVAVGGPHMYIFGYETMGHECFDYGVIGDGEDVFSELCRALYKEKEIPRLPGLLYRQDGDITGSGISQIDDLDSIAFPAIDLIDPFKYYSSIGSRKAVAICTSRGCPYRCTFCQVPHTRYRMRSTENIMQEIDFYVGKGITDFFFFDDLFNISRKRVIEISNQITKRGSKIGWMFRGRVDQIDDEMLKAAKKAGCHTISVGIEDSTNEGLKAIKKKITIEQAYNAVRLIRKNKIRCSTNWIIGFPHHKTGRDLDHLLKTALKMDSDYAQFGILQCLPGSELYDEAVSEYGIDPDAWKNYVLHPAREFTPPIWEKHFTKRELFDFYEKAFREYYIRPKVIVREMLSIRSWAEMFNKFNSFKTVFFKKG